MSRLSHRHLLVFLRRVDPHLLTPDDKGNRHQKNYKAESSRNNSDVLDAHSSGPGSKSEKDDDGKQVPDEDDADHCITENLENLQSVFSRI